MHGPYNRLDSPDFIQRFDNVSKPFGRIGIFRTMNSGKSIGLRGEPELLQNFGFLPAKLKVAQCRLTHHVANEKNSLANSFSLQIPYGRRRRSEQEARQMIRKHTVDLFRHLAIEAA